MTNGAPYPGPYDSISTAQAYYSQFSSAVRIASFLQFGASIPLGLFTATVASRLRCHRLNVAGVDIAFFGGITASIFLGLSSLVMWTISQAGVANEAGPLRILQLLMFALGGFGNVAAIGLLLAGVSVPSMFLRLVPQWACWFGLIIAAVAEVSTLSIVFPGLSLLLPIARFSSFVWMVVAGFSIPARRASTAH